MELNRTANLLEAAMSELQHLRAERDRLAAQMDVVNIFGAALLGPPKPQVYGTDIIGTLRTYVEMLRHEAKAEKAKDFETAKTLAEQDGILEK